MKLVIFQSRSHDKGRRPHPPHIQGAVVEGRKKSCGIDSDEPVRFLAAEGGLIQRVILRAGAQIGKTLPDGPHIRKR